MTLHLKINPDLDLTPIKERFLKSRRIQVPNVLTKSSADYLYTILKNEIDWELVFNVGDKPYYKTRDQLNKMNHAQLQEMRGHILKNAKTSFQYMYYTYNIYDRIFLGKKTDHPIHEFHAFVNSGDFFELITKVTGMDNFSFADSQATAYGPGHFLNEHNDKVPGETRIFAYVLNFTPKWEMDWGGILQFHGKDGNLECGFVPGYNILNLFEVPQKHTVSFVTPFAKDKRMAITGWLRESDDAHLLKKTI